MEDPMATAAIPYITFAGNAREALTFYQSVFGGKVEISTFGDFNVPGVPADGVMHGALTTDEFAVYGSDAMVTGDLDDANRIRIAIAGDDLDTLSGSFDALAQGGSVVTPLEKQVWGDTYGEVVDQYGIAWMFDIGGTRA
jgi:PhnB protein